VAIAEKDKKILRDLAKKVAEIANSPEQDKRRELWTRHNDLDPVKPMILCFPEGSWRELLPPDTLQTSDDFARGCEWDLRHRIYYWEHLRGDHVIEATVVAPTFVRDTGWGFQVNAVRPSEPYGAAHYEPVFKDESDIDKIRMPTITVDREGTESYYQRLCEVFDGILPIERRGCTGFGFAIFDQFMQWRGLDQAFFDMTDRPKWLHAVLERMTQWHLCRLDQLEQQNLLSLNNGNHYTGSGGTGFTKQLPKPGFDGKHVRLIDLWAHATTQMFADVSPAMHEEFALQYERRFLARFGLACYGCCEPLDKKLDLVKTIPNLRRVSMSPWVNVERGAAGLGNKYIFSYKPNPAIVAGESWQPDVVRKGLRDVCQKTRGCVLEIILKDTHTCRNEPERMWEWTKIATEVAAEFAS